MNTKRQTWLVAPLLIPMIIGMLLLFALQINSSHERDPLFTDLTASPFYAINGFEDSYIDLTDQSQLDWDFVLPPNGGRLIMSNLPVPETGKIYNRFSLTDRNIEDFTIYIPFTLDDEVREAIQTGHHSYPALYFEGIGENWEIFLNGNSVAREIHLDDEGRISRYKSSHGVIVPINKSYLSESENNIVIRILGARSGTWTGLRYASPFYLGDISYMTTNHANNANLVLCAVFLLAGLIRLLYYTFRKTARYNLLFTAFTVLAAGYFFIRTPLIYSIIINTEYIRRLDYSLLYLFVFTGFAFVESLNPGKITKPMIVYGIVCVFFAVTHWFLSVWIAYEFLLIWQISTLLFLIYFIGYCLIWRFIKGAKDMAKAMTEDDGSKPEVYRSMYRYLIDTEFGNICFLVIILSLTGMIDIFSRVVFYSNLTLSQYSYLGVVLGMTYVLAKKSINRLDISANEVKGAGLTPDEIEIALLMISGKTQGDITRQLHLSTADINRYEDSIRLKLNLTNVSEAGRNEKPTMRKIILFSVILYVLILVVGSISFMFSMQQIIHTRKSAELTQMLETELIRLESSVNAEIAIAIKLANSPTVKRHMMDPGNLEMEKAALEEIDSYRNAFSGYSIFWVNDIDRIFYSDDNEPYWLDSDDPVNYWYNMTLYETDVYNFNINYNPDLDQIRLWINAPMFDDTGRPVGMVGTGIDLYEFIDTLYRNISDRTAIYFFIADGRIYGARDVGLIVDGANITDVLDELDIDILAEAKQLYPHELQINNIPNGIFAMGTIPLLDWYYIAIMPYSLADYDMAMTLLFVIVLVLFLLVLILFNLFIYRFLKSLHRASESLTMTANLREQMLVTENSILDRLNRMKVDFFQNMSHDFKTPLNVIVTSMYDVKDMLDFEIDKDLMRQILDDAEQEAMRMARMVDGAITYSSLADNKQIMEEIDIAPLFRKGAETYRALFERHGNDLTLDIPDTLPPIFGSADMLLHVLSNLLSNANRYTRGGEISVRITEDSGVMTVRVKDTGSGVKPELLPRIFERGVSDSGTGLGLSICKNTVESHNGTITMESEYGCGTEVIISLPIYRKPVRRTDDE